LLPEQTTEECAFDGAVIRTHSFIVKIWLEGSEKNGSGLHWRGNITHVPSGERRYLKGWGDIFSFIAPYLEGANGGMRFKWRLYQWLCRLGN